MNELEKQLILLTVHSLQVHCIVGYYSMQCVRLYTAHLLYGLTTRNSRLSRYSMLIEVLRTAHILHECFTTFLSNKTNKRCFFIKMSLRPCWQNQCNLYFSWLVGTRMTLGRFMAQDSIYIVLEKKSIWTLFVSGEKCPRGKCDYRDNLSGACRQVGKIQLCFRQSEHQHGQRSVSKLLRVSFA